MQTSLARRYLAKCLGGSTQVETHAVATKLSTVIRIGSGKSNADFLSCPRGDRAVNG